MNKLKELVNSRKFQVALGTVMTLLASALQGTTTWKESLAGIVLTVIGWLSAQAKVDAAKAGAPPPTTTNGG